MGSKRTSPSLCSQSGYRHRSLNRGNLQSSATLLSGRFCDWRQAGSGWLFGQPPKGATTATRGPPSLDRCLVWNCQKWQPGQRRGLGSGRVRPTLPPCSGWGQPKLFSRLSARSPDHRAEQDPPLCSQCARRTCDFPHPQPARDYPEAFEWRVWPMRSGAEGRRLQVRVLARGGGGAGAQSALWVRWHRWL